MSETLAQYDFSKIIEEQAQAFLQEVLDMILNLALENLASGGQWVTGHLAKSGRVELLEMEGSVIFGAAYAVFVEFGTRPHAAPLGPSLPHSKRQVRGKTVIKITGTPDMTTNPLDWWAWRKGERDAVQTKYGVHTSLGYGVWGKILKKGSDPHPYLRPAIQQVKGQVNRIAKKHGFKFKTS